MYCEVDLAKLIDPLTFALKLGEEVVAKVSAKNFAGYGLSSPESSGGALIVAKPSAPTEAPIRNSIDSTETKIAIKMPEVPIGSTGGLPILSYSLEWN